MAEKTILIIDEHAASRTFLANHLRAKQFNILEAPNGKEGLIVAWRREPDLVLFDPALADIPDKEFIQKLRNDQRTSTAQLIALSSDPSPARRETCLRAGVDRSSSRFRAIPAPLAGKPVCVQVSMNISLNRPKPCLPWTKSWGVYSKWTLRPQLFTQPRRAAC